jgi:hypothetical protein
VPILSVLILTTPRRVGKSLPSLLEKLNDQIGDRDVEVLALYDNKKSTVGAKRNALMSIANGTYLCFVDDDDDIADEYITEILGAIENNVDVDCVVFDELQIVDTQEPEHWKYQIKFKDYDGKYHYGRPAHTHVWLSSKTKNCKFPSQNFEEDSVWIDTMVHRITNLVSIDKILYYYNFSTESSETRG